MAILVLGDFGIFSCRAATDFSTVPGIRSGNLAISEFGDFRVCFEVSYGFSNLYEKALQGAIDSVGNNKVLAKSINNPIIKFK